MADKNSSALNIIENRVMLASTAAVLLHYFIRPFRNKNKVKVFLSTDISTPRTVGTGFSSEGLESFFHHNHNPRYCFSEDEFKKMSKDRKSGNIDAKVLNRINYYHDNTEDEIHKKAIADQTLRILERESLTLVRYMVKHPERYPQIKTNKDKNAFLEDWLHTYKQQDYYILKTFPSGFEMLTHQNMAFACPAIIEYFSNPSKLETDKGTILEMIDQELQDINENLSDFHIELDDPNEDNNLAL